MSERIDRVRVVNHNPFTLRDRHDGLLYTFVRDVAVDIPPDVAGHLFAFPGEPEIMEAYIARRHGWNRPEHAVIGDDGLMLWQRLVRNIEIRVHAYELRPVRGDDEPEPAAEAGEAPDALPEVRATRPLRAAARPARRVKRPLKRRPPPQRLTVAAPAPAPLPDIPLMMPRPEAPKSE